jgi:hypothetical protein
MRAVFPEKEFAGRVEAKVAVLPGKMHTAPP